MDIETKKRIEYECQFFDFSSENIVDALKTLLREHCESGVDGLTKMLRRKLLPAAVDTNAVEQAFDVMAETLKSQYAQGVDYGVSKVEGRIRECFHIPDTLYLPEDKIISTVENIDEQALDSEIKDLKQELKNAAFLLDEAKEELTLADSTIAVLEEVCATDFQPLPNLVPGRN